MKYHITYDIVSDKRRKKVSDLLSDFGVRIQFSVFRLDVSKKQMKVIKTKCEELINPKTDSVLFIPYCQNCEENIGFVGQETHIYPVNFVDS